MNYFILALVLLSAVAVDPRITVSIEPGPTVLRTTINHKGYDIKLITDSEATLFKLKEAVETLSGQKPEEIFIKDTTADIYKSNNWTEVNREFKVKDIKVNVTSEERESIRTYDNNGTDVRNVTGRVIEGFTSFTSSHYWSGDEVSATVRYELTRPAATPLHYSYNSEVGKDSFGINIKSYAELAANFDLKPGESAKFIVKFNEVKTNVLVEYETSLKGDVVGGYSDENKIRYYIAYDVNAERLASKMSAILKTTDLVTVVHLRDFSVHVINVATGKDIPFANFKTTLP